MDGAMKFVKGDVIASLVIWRQHPRRPAIGVGMKGMAVADALRRYGLLTIGDGLVTQIPALVLSTGAGVLVTRVASEEADTPLGDELVRQLLGVPKALQAAGLFVLLLAAVPGLPWAPFVVLGVALLGVGRARSRVASVERARAATEPTPNDRARSRPNEPAFVPLVVPWSIEVGSDLEKLLDAAPEGLRAAALGLREHMFAELGVPLAAPRVRVRASLTDGRLVFLSVYEVPAVVFRVPEEMGAGEAVALVRSRALDLLRARAADFSGWPRCSAFSTSSSSTRRPPCGASCRSPSRSFS